MEMSGTGAGRAPITVVVAARDAAAHIAGCVASVAWAGETLVVEGGSADDTRLIALAEGATVFTHPFSTIGRQRNLAVERARHDWVLVLDAEERCTPELAAEILAVVSGLAPGALPTHGGATPEAFALPRRSLFNGHQLRGGRWRPDAPVRLFRRRLRFDEVPGADRLVVDGVTVGTLDAGLTRVVDAAHDAVAERVARAARDWAQQQFGRGVRASAVAPPLHVVGRFLSSYVLRGGWRDGLTGLGLAFLDATEVALRWTQLWALSRREEAWPVPPGGGHGAARGPGALTPPPPRAPR